MRMRRAAIHWLNSLWMIPYELVRAMEGMTGTEETKDVCIRVIIPKSSVI